MRTKQQVGRRMLAEEWIVLIRRMQYASYGALLEIFRVGERVCDVRLSLMILCGAPYSWYIMVADIDVGFCTATYRAREKYMSDVIASWRSVRSD